MSSSPCQGSQADSWELGAVRDQATASMSHRAPCWKSGGFRIMFSNPVLSFTEVRGRRLDPHPHLITAPCDEQPQSCQLWPGGPACLELTGAQLPYKGSTFQTSCQPGMLKTAHRTTYKSVLCENLAGSEPDIHMLLFKLTQQLL